MLAINNSTGNYRGWTDFLWLKTLMISMKPIQVGIFRSIIEQDVQLKTVTIRPDIKPRMDSKVHLTIRRGDHLLRIHNIGPSPVTSGGKLPCSMQHCNLSHTILLKNHSMKESTRIWVTLISTVRSGGRSLKGYVVKKIPHLFHSLLKTKYPFFIPIKKRAFLMNILCYRLNFHLPMQRPW